MRSDARLRSSVWALLAVASVGAAVLPARAAVSRAGQPAVKRSKAEQKPAPPSRPPLSAEALDRAREALAGANQPEALAAAKELGATAASNAAVPLVELLAAGARPAVVIAVIDALRKLRDPAAIEVLLMYAGHRNPEVRRQAVVALGAFADARVVPPLLDRLGDAAPDVRGAAAEALANRGERAAAPRLLALVKRNDAGAAAPLGTTAPLALLPEIAELQGRISDANLASVLGELLKRQDVPDPVRVDIVKTLARVPGAAATTALVEYVGTLPGADSRASRTAAQKVIDERTDKSTGTDKGNDR